MVIIRCDECGESRTFHRSKQAIKNGWKYDEDEEIWLCPDCCEDDEDEPGSTFSAPTFHSSHSNSLGGFGGGSFGGGGAGF